MQVVAPEPVGAGRGPVIRGGELVRDAQEPETQGR